MLTRLTTRRQERNGIVSATPQPAALPPIILIEGAKRRVGRWLCFLLWLSPAILSAKTAKIKVLLLDGKTLQPIPNLSISLFGQSELQLQRDASGFATEPDGAKTIWVESLGTARKPFDYTICLPIDDQASRNWFFSTEEILPTGVESKNACSTKRVKPKPGELVLYIRHWSWWEKFVEKLAGP